ncbi:hypothetical protein LSAT2_011029 [Lamellibrachia satsuma]|nr:hypothetical protein LSAT2_011029 [Lamellibrachia satsuma]
MISAWCNGPTDYESVHYVCSSINPDEATTTALSTTNTVATSTSHIATESSAAESTVSTTDSTKRHVNTTQSTATVSSTTQSAATVSSTTQSTATVSSTTQSTATVSSSADSSESSAGETDTAGSQTNIALIAGLMTVACVAVMAAVLVVLVCRKRLPCVKLPATSEKELYASNISETRVETPSTYDTLTPYQPQQQPEPTYEPVDKDYYNITSDPVKYENTQMYPTAGGSTGYNNRHTMDHISANRQQQTSSHYFEPYGQMPV